MGKRSRAGLLEGLVGDNGIRLSLADGADLHRWSWGTVTSTGDLYSPVIFGSSRDLICECGLQGGTSQVGAYCLNCRTIVFADAAAARRCLFGMIKLPGEFLHPLGDELIGRFPVAPIAFRLNEAGEPNALGLKYERLSEFVGELSREVELLEMADVMTRCAWAQPMLQQLQLDIIGRPGDTFTGVGQPSTLADVLLSCVLQARRETPIVLQTMALTFDICTRI